MSDIADRSDALIDAVVERGLREVRAMERVKATGQCLFCGEDVVAGALFCNVDCRDDYEREAALHRIAGRGC